MPQQGKLRDNGNLRLAHYSLIFKLKYKISNKVGDLVHFLASRVLSSWEMQQYLFNSVNVVEKVLIGYFSSEQNF